MNELKELDKAVKQLKIDLLKAIPELIRNVIFVMLGMIMMALAIWIDGCSL